MDISYDGIMESSDIGKNSVLLPDLSPISVKGETFKCLYKLVGVCA